MLSSKKTWLPTALSFLIIFAVYFPSLFHAAKGDHLFYLIELADLESFGDILNYSLTLNRTRLINPGDYVYFRPLFYFGMALERFFFQYHFMAWQAAGMAVHLLCVGQLIRLLKAIRPGTWTPALFGLLFGVLYLPSDMVTWHHMNMYMVCYIFVLLALIRFLRFEREHHVPSFWVMLGYFTLAGFTNEFGVVACGLMGLFLLIKHGFKQPAKTHPLLCLLPLAAYFYFSIADFLSRVPASHLPYALKGVTDSIDIASLCTHIGVVLWMSFVLPLSPGLFQINAAERNFISFGNAERITDIIPQFGLAAGINTLLLLLGITVAVHWLACRRNIITTAPKQALSMGLFSFVLALVYVLVLVGARGHIHFVNYLSMSLYHFYPICLFLTVGAYCLLYAAQDTALPAKQLFFRGLLMIITGGILLNAIKTYDLNVRVREAHAITKNSIESIQRFINTHQHEPDFAISLAWPDGYPKPVKALIGRPPYQRTFSGQTTAYLFKKHIRPDAKYRLRFSVTDGIFRVE